jgi:hypothetical protein
MSAMHRRGIKLGFRNKSAEERMGICRRTIRGFKKAPAAHLLPGKREELQEKLAVAEENMALVARLRSELRTALGERNKSVKELCHAVTFAAKGFVGNVSFDGPAMLKGGLELAAVWRRQPPPGAPKFFRAERGAHVGSVALRWKRPTRRCFFIVEATTDPSGRTGWERQVACTKAKCVLKDLEPGRLCWFRVAAIGSRGQSPWSQSVALRPG